MERKEESVICFKIISNCYIRYNHITLWPLYKYLPVSVGECVSSNKSVFTYVCASVTRLLLHNYSHCSDGIGNVVNCLQLNWEYYYCYWCIKVHNRIFIAYAFTGMCESVRMRAKLCTKSNVYLNNWLLLTNTRCSKQKKNCFRSFQVIESK